MWQKDNGKSFFRFYIYRLAKLIGKSFWKIIYKYSYIYDMAKDSGKSFFILYIYDMAKLIGKSSEIHTNNYRQL